jgi:glycosyltransferase involved in cell wall biosynthesis
MAEKAHIRLGVYLPGVSDPEHIPLVSGVRRYWRDLLPAIPRNKYEVVFLPDGLVSSPANRPHPAAGHQTAEHRSRGVLGRLWQLLPSSFRLAVGLLRETLNLRRIIRAASVDIFHSSLAGFEIAPIAARLAGVRVVVATYHNLPSEGYITAAWLQRLVEWLCARSLNVAIANTHNTRTIWENRCPALKSRFRTIPHGLDPGQYLNEARPPARRGEFDLPASVPLLVVPARLHPMKGIHYLLDAMPAILQKHPDAQLLLIGDGGERPALEAHVKRLGLNNAVRFLGWRKDVLRIVSVCDVVVLPSVNLETFGRSLAEAMILGKPCVATNVGGVPEVVEHGVTGYIVPPRDSAALAGAICRLLNDSGLRQQLGQAGRERIANHFSIAHMREQTLLVYRQLLKK